MKQILNVLIIDDHPIIVNAYKRVFNIFNSSNGSTKFEVFSAYSIQSVMQKIENANSRDLFDFVLLDISLSPCHKYRINSGEELGLYLKKQMPRLKIIVLTSLDDNLRLSNILTNLSPNGFFIKSDVTNENLLQAVATIISGHTYYCKTICDLLKKKTENNVILDSLDIDILKELSNSSTMKEMLQLIPLTKSGIEKRKRQLREKLQTKGNSDRELVLTAREKGFI